LLFFISIYQTEYAMKLTNIVSLALVALALVACKKEDGEPPVISISQPLATASFSVGDTLSISGTVTDDEGLHEVFVNLVNTSNGDSVLWSMGGHTHDNPYTFQGSYVLNVAPNTGIELRVEAIDETDLQTESHLHFHIMN
jgi:hypothetical protein